MEVYLSHEHFQHLLLLHLITGRKAHRLLSLIKHHLFNSLSCFRIQVR
uniref:Nuclear movement protein nudc n=1 Tax=Rhizophora mucronata TaxID=61149 RepID=A0A2P2JRV4_RHIMU